MTGTDVNMSGLLLNVDEVAAALRVTKRAVYAMLSRDQLPGVVRIGKRVRFRAAAIVALATQGAKQSA
jgi:excisionase family DNA binding protein